MRTVHKIYFTSVILLLPLSYQIILKSSRYLFLRQRWNGNHWSKFSSKLREDPVKMFVSSLDLDIAETWSHWIQNEIFCTQELGSFLWVTNLAGVWLLGLLPHEELLQTEDFRYYWDVSSVYDKSTAFNLEEIGAPSLKYFFLFQNFEVITFNYSSKF